MRTGLDWTPAKCLIRTNRSTRDSPLEREGFEPLVPPEKGRASASPPRRFGETGRACLSATSGDRFLELDFGGEAGAITPDRQHRQFAAALSVSHRAVLRRKASIDLNPAPFRGVPDIVELQTVLLGPEERHRVEALARPEHVAGSCLAPPFGDDPVLDADGLASQPVGPSGDIAGGPDAGDARLEIRVDGPAVGERAQIMDMRKIATRDAEVDRFSAGGEEQRAESAAGCRPRPALLDPSDRLRPRARRASARPHARGDTAVNSNPGFLGERGLRPHPDPDDDEVGIELFPTL